MCAFATNQSLSEESIELLAMAQRGDRNSLRAVCNRFQLPLAAMVLRNSGDWDLAKAAVEPLLEQLCQELLAGRLTTANWAQRAIELASQQQPRKDGDDDGQVSSLEGLGSIPRVVKRRALRSYLALLPLPELTAVLLAHVEKRKVEDMVGLVADTPSEAATCLVTAHQMLQSEIQRCCGNNGEQP